MSLFIIVHKRKKIRSCSVVTVVDNHGDVSLRFIERFYSAPFNSLILRSTGGDNVTVGITQKRYWCPKSQWNISTTQDTKQWKWVHWIIYVEWQRTNIWGYTYKINRSSVINSFKFICINTLFGSVGYITTKIQNTKQKIKLYQLRKWGKFSKLG